MNTLLDKKRIAIFLAFAFGFAWITGLVIYLTGGLTNSPVIAPNMTLAFVLLATTYMWAPAAANILTRLITREGWSNTGLRPNFRRGWRFWLVAWLLPPLLTALGGAIFYVLFPQFFDPSLGYVKALLAKAPQANTVGVTPQMVIIQQFLFAILAAPLINGLFTFGEEFGWRAYLMPKLMPLGGRAAMIVMGVIWGIWHWPVIFMGYEYGFNYPGAPVTGPLTFIWITFVFGTLLAWLTLRGGSVWPAVIGHAAINASAGLAIYFSQGQPNTLLGPLSVGLIGSLGFALMTLLILRAPNGLRAQSTNTLPVTPEAEALQEPGL